MNGVIVDLLHLSRSRLDNNLDVPHTGRLQRSGATSYIEGLDEGSGRMADSNRACAGQEVEGLPPHFYVPREGELLYHYTSIAGARGILAGDALWLSDFACMNDPDEYTYARDCFLEVYRDRPVFVDMVPRLLATSAAYPRLMTTPANGSATGTAELAALLEPTPASSWIGQG